MDEPEQVIRLISDYPEFKPMYDDLYQMCLNTEKVIEMFSKELQILDENTVQYMMDEMQGTIDDLQGKLEDKDSIIANQDAVIQELQRRLKDLEKGNGTAKKE